MNLKTKSQIPRGFESMGLLSTGGLALISYLASPNFILLKTPFLGRLQFL